MVAAVIYFITFEDTAITTVPPVYADSEVFVPQTPTPLPTKPPTPTPNPLLAYTWDGGIDEIFESQCSLCHGTNGGFSVKSYGDIILGGNNGLTLIPGNAEVSKLLKVAVPDGEHPGQFSEVDLEKVRIWILNGAVK